MLTLNPPLFPHTNEDTGRRGSPHTVLTRTSTAPGQGANESVARVQRLGQAPEVTPMQAHPAGSGGGGPRSRLDGRPSGGRIGRQALTVSGNLRSNLISIHLSSSSSSCPS